MTMTKDDVADLREGDIIEITYTQHPGVILRGPVRNLRPASNSLAVGSSIVRFSDGETGPQIDTVRVIERAARPVYKNSDRTEYKIGDIVTYDDYYFGRIGPFRYTGEVEWAGSQEAGGYTAWVGSRGRANRAPVDHADELILLVDGETIEAVPE